MARADLPVRVKSPEERELDLKREELAALEADLVEWELQVSTLEADLTAFEAEYLRVVGRRYAELDDLNARIAEIQAIRRPGDDAAQAAASKARRAAKESAAQAHEGAAQQPIPSFDPPAEIKTLFRMIARKLHPDLASTDEERARRHVWMTKVNDAYRRQDAEALLELNSAWEASPESVLGMGVASELVRVIRQIAQVRQRIEVIRRAIDTLNGGDLYKLYEKCNAWRDAGGDLLQEMAERVDGRIAAARRELDVLETEVL